MEQNDGSSSGSPPRKKAMRGNRNQPIVSCLECRRMKWKCDREFPCANCKKRGLESLCPDGKLNGAKGDRQLVMSLQQRVQQLESALAETQKQLSVQVSHPLLSFPSSTPDPPASSSQSTFLQNMEEDLDHEPSRRESADETQEYDHGQLTLGDEPGSSGFFGTAGATYLGLKNDIKPNVNQTWHFGFDGTPSGLTDSFPFQSRSVTLEELHHYLPERRVADHHVAVYFQHASFLNHVVNESTFTREFLDEVYGGNGRTVRLNNHRLAVVYLVLAIGAQMDTNMRPCNDTGESYYQIARACLAYDPTGSVMFVQAIHIMGRYLANASKGPTSSQNFWTILGMGVRCAQQVGLHRDGSRWKLARDELETRRRVFWEIYSEDLFQSITQARPCLISRSIVDAQFPTLSADPTTFELFHHHKYRLSKIMAMVNALQTRAGPVPYNETMEVDKALREFQNELPPVLSQTKGEDEQHIYRNLAIKLYLTEAFMFLHRVRFARALRDHPREPLESAYRYSYVSQLESSRIMIEILRDALAVNENLTVRCWIFFFHAYTSLVNFCATVMRSPTSSLARAVFAQAEDGIRLFDVVGDEHKARDDIATLHRLYHLAQTAISSNTSSRDIESADLIGIGTTLHRVRPRMRSPPPDASESAGTSKIMLPTTLAEAVAVQDDLFNLPFDFGGVFDLPSETPMSSDALQMPMLASLDHHSGMSWLSTSSGMQVGGTGTADSNPPVAYSTNEFEAMGFHPDLDLELDFEAFLAELGMSPQRF